MLPDALYYLHFKSYSWTWCLPFSKTAIPVFLAFGNEVKFASGFPYANLRNPFRPDSIYGKGAIEQPRLDSYGKGEVILTPFTVGTDCFFLGSPNATYRIVITKEQFTPQHAGNLSKVIIVS